MKTCLTALGLCLALPLSAVAASGPDDAAVQELIALEEHWMQAENTHDAGTLRTILEVFNKATAPEPP